MPSRNTNLSKPHKRCWCCNCVTSHEMMPHPWLCLEAEAGLNSANNRSHSSQQMTRRRGRGENQSRRSHTFIDRGVLYVSVKTLDWQDLGSDEVPKHQSFLLTGALLSLTGSLPPPAAHLIYAPRSVKQNQSPTHSLCCPPSVTDTHTHSQRSVMSHGLLGDLWLNPQVTVRLVKMWPSIVNEV